VGTALARLCPPYIREHRADCTLSKSKDLFSVIASEAKQSRAARTTLDCFGAMRLAMTNRNF
jgi:hypothetical protein